MRRVFFAACLTAIAAAACSEQYATDEQDAGGPPADVFDSGSGSDSGPVPDAAVLGDAVPVACEPAPAPVASGCGLGLADARTEGAIYFAELASPAIAVTDNYVYYATMKSLVRVPLTRFREGKATSASACDTEVVHTFATNARDELKKLVGVANDGVCMLVAGSAPDVYCRRAGDAKFFSRTEMLGPAPTDSANARTLAAYGGRAYYTAPSSAAKPARGADAIFSVPPSGPVAVEAGWLAAGGVCGAHFGDTLALVATNAGLANLSVSADNGGVSPPVADGVQSANCGDRGIRWFGTGKSLEQGLSYATQGSLSPLQIKDIAFLEGVGSGLFALRTASDRLAFAARSEQGDNAVGAKYLSTNRAYNSVFSTPILSFAAGPRIQPSLAYTYLDMAGKGQLARVSKAPGTNASTWATVAPTNLKTFEVGSAHALIATNDDVFLAVVAKSSCGAEYGYIARMSR